MENDDWVVVQCSDTCNTAAVGNHSYSTLHNDKNSHELYPVFKPHTPNTVCPHDSKIIMAFHIMHSMFAFMH